MWKFNHFFKADIACAPDVKPVFDGKNIWVMGATGTLHVVEFWGPYSDDDPYSNETNLRWTEGEIDLLNYPNFGPKVRVIRQHDMGGVGQICYYDNFVYWTDGTYVKRVAVTAASTTPSTFATFPVETHSEIVGVNGRIYAVGIHPTTQLTNDTQKLYYVDTTTGAVSLAGDVPGRKQQKRRSLVVSNDTLYISGYNTRSVYKFNALTGAYLTGLTVNRDLEALYRNDNDVYVVSSLKGKVTIGDKEYANSMVSQITESDTINHKHGILNGGHFFADDGTYIWAVTDAKGLQRTKKSNNATFVDKDNAAIKDSPDYQFEMVDPVGNVISNIINILVTPSFTYQFFDGSTFQDVTVPKYIHFICEDKVCSISSVNVLRWENDIELNQYAAISTGGLGYKQD